MTHHEWKKLIESNLKHFFLLFNFFRTLFPFFNCQRQMTNTDNVQIIVLSYLLSLHLCSNVYPSATLQQRASHKSNARSNKLQL